MFQTQKMRTMAAIFVAAALVLISCATKIPLQVQRTPTLDTTGIQRLAIMPFEGSYQNAAQHATSVATARITETNRFTLVSPQEIQRLRSSGQNIEGHVDALFTGQITHIGQSTNQRSFQLTNRETGVTTTYYYYVREVEVQFNYSLMRARDGSLIGPVNKRGSTSSRADTQGELPSVDSLAQRVIDSQMRYLARDVAPYTIRVNRTLETETIKELKPPMEAALAQVKSGSYKQALDAYLSIYQQNNNIAAAVNASILYEALGETQTALTFMQGVYAATGNPKASEVIARLNKELQEMAGTAEYDNTLSPSENVANYASDEIQRILPANARVWIHNNAPAASQNIVNDVVDNLTASFIRSSITVIDRESIALILREQNFQAGGNVSDNDFVSMGKLAGANTLVIINITGTGGARRLQVRVLDIERGVPTFQSDTGERWRL